MWSRLRGALVGYILIARDLLPNFAVYMPAKENAFSVEPRIRINCGRRFAFGPGKADLLEQIKRTGSISEAAKAMEMSYMRAWTLVKSLDRGFAEPLVMKIRGGSARGGATLSKTGLQVLALYREMEKAGRTSLQASAAKLERLLQR